MIKKTTVGTIKGVNSRASCTRADISEEMI